MKDFKNNFDLKIKFDTNEDEIEDEILLKDLNKFHIPNSEHIDDSDEDIIDSLENDND